MPTPVDNLTTKSSEEEKQKAISECIDIEIAGGRPQRQAMAMCYSMAAVAIRRSRKGK